MARLHPGLILLALSALTAAKAHAADPKPVDLGPPFVGQYDVTFRPFADAKRIDRQVQTELARFSRDDKKWLLVFDRAQLPRDIPIRDSKDTRGVEQAGYLTAAVNAMRSGEAKADVFRSDVIETGQLSIGLITAHSVQGGKPILLQQALCEVSPRLYYSLVMTSPAPAKDIDKDAGVLEAAEVFKAIVDSIDRVDLSRIREDQDERLIAMRSLLVNWTPKAVLKALVPEQLLLFRQNDKDIGYAFVVEQPADALPKSSASKPDVPPDPSTAGGVRVGMRMRTIREGKTVDVETWMFASLDRDMPRMRHEVWKTITIVRQPDAKTEKDKEQWFAEVGASDLTTERVFDRNVLPDDLKEMDRKSAEEAERAKREGRPPDDRNVDRPYRMVDAYNLTVRTETRSAVANPFHKQLPPYYLPQAMATLIPRLVPINTPNAYAFVAYNSDTREVMFRYIDVKPEGDVTLNGRKQRAIAVLDRIGYNGDPTTHYLTSKGVYLGSINTGAKIEIIPTDRETLIRLFSDANLTQPEAPKDAK